MEQKITSPVVKGLIISMALIIFGLVLQFTDLYMNKALGSIQYLIILAGIIWACTSFSNQMNGNVTFGNVFAHGFKTTAFITALMAVYSVVAMKFLFPEMMDKALDVARLEMEKQGQLAEDQIDQALEFTKKFFVPITIATIVVVFLIVGAISSLIGAAVAKKNPQTPFQQG